MKMKNCCKVPVSCPGFIMCVRASTIRNSKSFFHFYSLTFHSENSKDKANEITQTQSHIHTHGWMVWPQTHIQTHMLMFFYLKNYTRTDFLQCGPIAHRCTP